MSRFAACLSTCSALLQYLHASNLLLYGLFHLCHSRYIMVMAYEQCCRSMRYEFVQLARKHQAAYIQLYVKCPLEVALQRNAMRPDHQQVPEPVMRRMAQLLEVPGSSKHAWDADPIVLDSSNLNVGCIRYTHCQCLHACSNAMDMFAQENLMLRSVCD